MIITSLLYELYVDFYNSKKHIKNYFTSKKRLNLKFLIILTFSDNLLLEKIRISNKAKKQRGFILNLKLLNKNKKLGRSGN